MSHDCWSAHAYDSPCDATGCWHLSSPQYSPVNYWFNTHTEPKIAITVPVDGRAPSADTVLTTKRDMSLQWRHNERHGVSNHQPHHCLLNRLFNRRSKKTSKLRVTGLCAGNSPATGGRTMTSNTENVSIWWRHHDSAYIWPSPFGRHRVRCFSAFYWFHITFLVSCKPCHSPTQM